MSKYSLAIKKAPTENDTPIAYLMKTKNGQEKQAGILCLEKKQKGKPKKTLDPEIEKILQSANLTDEQRKLISSSVNSKGQTTHPDFFINPSNRSIQEEIKLPPGYKFAPYKRSYPGSERDSLYVTGISGAGKSYFIGQYLKDYKKKFPKRDIVVFSGVDQDKALDEHNPIRINRETLLEQPMDIEELEDTCCVFDDVISIPDKQVALAIRKIRDEVLEMGRHKNITCLCTSHIAMAHRDTMYPLRESYNIVCFPRSNQEQVTNVCESYLGLKRNRALIDYIIEMNPRWVCFNKQYPSYILTKKCCMLKK